MLYCCLIPPANKYLCGTNSSFHRSLNRHHHRHRHLSLSLYLVCLSLVLWLSSFLWNCEWWRWSGGSWSQDERDFEMDVCTTVLLTENELSVLLLLLLSVFLTFLFEPCCQLQKREMNTVILLSIKQAMQEVLRVCASFYPCLTDNWNYDSRGNLWITKILLFLYANGFT